MAKAPARGHVLACERPAGARAALPPWIVGGRVERRRKPIVDGELSFLDVLFSLRTSAGRTSFTGNGLPSTHPIGHFPAAAGDNAAPYTRGTGTPTRAELTGDVPATPKRRRAPACVSAAQPVGVALDGVPILAPHSAAGEDLAAREVTDACGGRTDAQGRYYYRAALTCLPRGGRRRHDRQVGFARDGSAIFGPRGARGRFLRSRHLDRCHGHTHRVTIRGKRRRAYHHHVTADFPYVLGCFRARPSSDWRHVARAPLFPPPEPLEAPAPDARAPDALAIGGVSPRFDPSRSDYYVRCEQPVRLDVAAPDGVAVSVDDGRATSGEHTTTVALEPNQAFAFEVIGGAADGRYHVRCLPPDFPAFGGTRTGPTQAEMYVTTPSLGAQGRPYVIVFDNDGVPLWWHRASDYVPFDAKLLPDGNLAWSRVFGLLYGTSGEQRYDEVTLAGTVVRELRTVGSPTDHHELQVLENGNRLLLTYRERDHVDLSSCGTQGLPSDATVVDAEVQELTPAGDLVWSWNTKDHVSLEEGDRWCDASTSWPDPQQGRAAYDIVHVNSAEETADGDVIISLRHTDAVYRVDRATGNVEWKLGGTATPQSLEVIGDDANAGATFGGQHDARELPDGTITVHDNRSMRGEPPRDVRFAIDEVAGTATLVEQVSDPEAPYSMCCGGTRKLPGGNWVTSWGSLPLITEHTPSGERVFRLIFDRAFSYRADPVLPGQLRREDLRAGMSAMHPR